MLKFNFLQLLWLLFFILPIIFFYFLRFLYKKQPVSSSFLWKKITDKTQGYMSLRKWSILLLAVQLLAVIFGVFSLTEPVFNYKKDEPYGMIYLLDNTAGMNLAGSGNMTKFEFSKKKLIEEIEKADKNRNISLFTINSELKIEVKPTQNKKQIVSKIKKLKPSYDSFNEEEVNNKLNIWLSEQKNKFEAVVITDAAAASFKRLEKTFDNNLDIIIIKGKAQNPAVSGLKITEGNKINFTINNNSTENKSIDLDLWFIDKAVSTFHINAKHGKSSYQFPSNEIFQTGNYKLKIRSVNESDYTNESYYSHNEQYKPTVLISGENNIFIDSFFESSSFVIKKTKHAASSEYKNFDFIVINNEKTDLSVKSNIILFTDEEDKSISFKRTGGILSSYPDKEIMLRFFENTPLYANNALVLKNTPNKQPIFFIDNEPVAAYYNDKKFLKVIFGFDLYNSNFGITEAFPIILNNIIKYTIPQWNNPASFNFTTGREYSIYYNGKFKNIKNDNLYAIKKPPLIMIKTFNPGSYELKLNNKTLFFSSNTDISESDTSVKTASNQKNKNIILKDYFEKNFDLKKIFIFLFILFLVFEWFLWNTNPSGGSKK